MPIHAPAPHLLSSSRLSRRARFRRRPPGGSLAVLPLIDLMLVLVLFLLPEFRASGEVCGCLHDFELPAAEHTSMLERAPIVAIVDGNVTLDVGGAGRRESMESLTADLLTLRRNWPMIHPHEPYPGKWVLQADRRTDFRLVRQVFAAAARAGFTDAELLVNHQVPPESLGIPPTL